MKINRESAAMTEPLVTIYERKFHISVDPAKPGEDVTVWWYFDKDGEPQILKTEQPSNKSVGSDPTDIEA